MPVFSRAIETLKRFREQAAASDESHATALEIPGRLAVMIEGFEGSELVNILKIVSEQTRAGGLRPIIITHTASLDQIRAFKLPVEVMIDPKRCRIDDLPMALRLDQQLQGIIRLWQPVEVVTFTKKPQMAAIRLRELIKIAIAGG